MSFHKFEKFVSITTNRYIFNELWCLTVYIRGLQLKKTHYKGQYPVELWCHAGVKTKVFVHQIEAHIFNLL